jgi:uncharacterized phage protein (TIGR01671 family)
MNDRYLFRAKRLDNKEWAIGSLLQQYFSTRHGVIDAICTNMPEKRKTNRYPIDPKTIGQCTGYRTEQQRKLFEGDEIKIGTRLFAVVFVFGAFYLMDKETGNKIRMDHVLLCNPDFEIIEDLNNGSHTNN